jgi:hypothetical protein
MRLHSKGGFMMDFLESMEVSKMDILRRLISSNGNIHELVISLQVDPERYEWREINWTLFLYDKQEDFHIPEVVYMNLLSERIMERFTL